MIHKVVETEVAGTHMINPTVIVHRVLKSLHIYYWIRPYVYKGLSKLLTIAFHLKKENTNLLGPQKTHVDPVSVAQIHRLKNNYFFQFFCP